MSKIDLFASSEAVGRKEKACIRGVVSDRVHALTRLLGEGEWLGCNDHEDGISEVMGMLLELRLNLNGFNEELAATMQGYSLNGSGLSYEHEIALIEEHENNQGFEDSRGI
jgi:hypothetical protein